MRATGINHVSISARDLEESTRFYEEVFGMERIATPIFDTPVQWLRVGDLQLHLFLDEHGTRPRRHHLGLTIDDFEAAYEAIRERTVGRVGRANSSSLPSGPGPALLPRPGRQPDRAELARRVDTIDRSRYPELRGSRSTSRRRPSRDAPSSISTGASS